jgi:hypothetical protein
MVSAWLKLICSQSPSQFFLPDRTKLVPNYPFDLGWEHVQIPECFVCMLLYVWVHAYICEHVCVHVHMYMYESACAHVMTVLMLSSWKCTIHNQFLRVDFHLPFIVV